MSKTDPLRHLATRRQAAWWPMLDVRRTTLPERVPQLGKRRTAVSDHHGVDVVATRKFSRTDPQHNGTLGFPSHTKEKARERAKVKEKEEKATKEKDKCLDLGSIQLGDRHLATCRIGTRTVTRQSWSHCVQRCGMYPTRTSKAGRR